MRNVAPRARSRLREAPWLGVAAIGVSAAALVPLGFVAWAAVQTGWSAAASLILRPRVGELFVNTALLVVLTLPLCTVLAVALAWITERTDVPGRRWWSVLAGAPLAVPAFVQSYAWVSLFPAMHGLGAAVLVSVLAYFPFLYLPVAASMRRLDPALEDVAQSLALRPRAVMRRIVLPQLRLAIWGGALLVALHLLAEYGLFAALRFDTFTTAIFDQFQSTFSGAAANMLAGVLVACSLGLLALEALTRGRARYARVGAGSARLPPPRALGRRATMLGVALPALVSVLALGVPAVTLLRWVIAGGADAWRSPALVSALSQTLGLAAAGALVTTCAAVPMAWLSVRAPGRLQRALEALNYVMGSLPGIVVALALVSITVRVARPLYQTLFTVLAAYLLLFLPRALISLRAGIAQAPVELENIAQSLGRTPAQALRQVTLRLAAPSAAAGAALVFLGIASELTATLLLAPNGTRTLATGFWALASELDYGAAAPYACLMIALSLPITWILHQQSRRVAGR
ncbi:MAG: iron ABC transporter permease [Betaproteobacteria bacterium]